MLKTYFISGVKSKQLSELEFNTYYRPRIIAAVAVGHSFVLSHLSEVDLMAQKLLIYLLAKELNRMKVYHLENQSPLLYDANIPVKGNFKSIEHMENAMIEDSNDDITFILSEDKKELQYIARSQQKLES